MKYFIIWHRETGYMAVSAKNANELIKTWPNHSHVHEGITSCSYTRHIDALSMAQLLNETAELPNGFTVIHPHEVKL